MFSRRAYEQVAFSDASHPFARTGADQEGQQRCMILTEPINDCAAPQSTSCGASFLGSVLLPSIDSGHEFGGGLEAAIPANDRLQAAA